MIWMTSAAYKVKSKTGNIFFNACIMNWKWSALFIFLQLFTDTEFVEGVHILPYQNITLYQNPRMDGCRFLP